MAAASITFAMCVAGVGIYFYKNPPAGYIAANTVNKSNDTLEKSENINGLTSTSDGELKSNNASQSQYVGNSNHANQDALGTNHNSKIGSKVGGDIVNAERSADNSSKTFPDNDLLNQNNALAQSNNFNHAGSFEARDESGSDRNKNIVVSDNQGLSHENILIGKEYNQSINKPALTTLLASERIKYASQEKEVDPFLVMMAKLEQRELELREDKKSDKGKKKSIKNVNEKLWTSFGFAAGSFSSAHSNVNSLETSLSQPSNSLSAARTADASKDVAKKQSKASGTSYSLGLSVGTKVSERWIVHGGVNYLSQISSYETTTISRDGDQNFSLFTIKEVANNTEPKVTSTAPYNVNSNLQFLSVPLQAGYMALKRKFGIQINTGLSTELFLQSVASAVVNNQSKSVRDGWGSQSPYRTVNFSGLFGTEFSYRFGDHYRVALNPGLRYPFGSLYKSEIGIRSIPFTVDVGVKLRYIFR
jgi:hypothetical protein